MAAQAVFPDPGRDKSHSLYPPYPTDEDKNTLRLILNLNLRDIKF